MQPERRKQPRVPKRFEGTWRGASGAMRCTVGDISLTGCYVHGLATPGKGETTVVTIQFGPGASIELTGKVIYTDAGMGFAVHFDLPEADAQRLSSLLERIKPEAAIA